MTNVFDHVPSDQIPDKSDAAPLVKRSKNREDVLTSTELRTGRRKLSELVDAAFNTLEESMRVADYATAVRAAVAILDRTGFGPKSTMDINTTHIDLSELTKDQLAERALRIHRMISGARDAEIITKSPILEHPVTH